MIAEITFQTQYGKQTQSGINLAPDHNKEKDTAFAHSVQDAVEYIKSYPLFADAIIDTVNEGAAYIISSQWKQRNADFDALFEFEGGPLPPFKRQQVIIRSRNTIYENTGYGK